jgi:hypothetical protein
MTLSIDHGRDAGAIGSPHEITGSKVGNISIRDSTASMHFVVSIPETDSNGEAVADATPKTPLDIDDM